MKGGAAMGGGWGSGWIPILDDTNPEQGRALLHRPLPGHPGYTMCGRLVDDPSALQRRKPAGLDDCQACSAFARAEAAASTKRPPTATKPSPDQIDRPRTVVADPAGAADVAQEPATSTAQDPAIWPSGLVRTWEASGWVRLDGSSWAAHRPHPERSPGWTMCGQSFDPATVAIYRIRPKTKPPCVRCAKIREDAIEAERRARRTARSGVRPAVAPRGPDLGTLRSPRWVVLPEGDGSRAHRPDPEFPAWAMCGARLPTPVPSVYRRRPADAPECASCREELHQARIAAGIEMETVRITDPEQVDRLDRARARGVSIRTVRGGLPTLGRDR
jgi:hypothetical protein